MTFTKSYNYNIATSKPSLDMISILLKEFSQFSKEIKFLDEEDVEPHQTTTYSESTTQWLSKELNTINPRFSPPPLD